MKILKSVLVVCIVLFVSCVENKTNADIDWTRYPMVNLSAPQKMEAVGKELVTENRMWFLDDLYVFIQPLFSSGREIHLYQLRNDTMTWVREMIRKGEGPLDAGEGNVETHVLDDGSVVFGATGHNSKVFSLPIDKRLSINDLREWDLDMFSLKSCYINRMLPIDNARFLVQTAGYVPSLLAYYELGDSSLTYIPFPYPDDGCGDFSHTMMYGGPMMKRPGQNQFVYQMAGGRCFFTFSLNDKKEMEDIHYLYNIPPKYKMRDDGVGVSEMEEDVYLSSAVCCTEKYIYLALLDITWKDFIEDNTKNKNEGYDSWYYRQIHVFDWKGNPVKTYLLDQYVSNFVVDEKDAFLYGNSVDLETDEVSIVRYGL